MLSRLAGSIRPRLTSRSISSTMAGQRSVAFISGMICSEDKRLAKDMQNPRGSESVTCRPAMTREFCPPTDGGRRLFVRRVAYSPDDQTQRPRRSNAARSDHHRRRDRGLSAAIYLGRAERDTLVIDSGHSMAKWEPMVENYLGFPKGVGGEELLKYGRRQAKRHGVKFKKDEIKNVSAQKPASSCGEKKLIGRIAYSSRPAFFISRQKSPA